MRKQHMCLDLTNGRRALPPLRNLEPRVQQTRPLNRLPEYLCDTVLCTEVIAIVKIFMRIIRAMGRSHVGWSGFFWKATQ